MRGEFTIDDGVFDGVVGRVFVDSVPGDIATESKKGNEASGKREFSHDGTALEQGACRGKEEA